MNAIMTPGLADWLREGERGVSSETMVEVFEGMFPGTLCKRPSHPHDPADFHRCVKLLEAVPEYRARLHEMRLVSLVWNLLVEHWDALETLFREEEPTGRAPKLYDEMKRLIHQGGALW